MTNGSERAPAQAQTPNTILGARLSDDETFSRVSPIAKLKKENRCV